MGDEMKQKAITNVTMKDQLNYHHQIAKGTPYLENNGFMLMGETEEGYDVTFVSCLFNSGGGKETCWATENGSKGQTTFLAIPKDMRGQMNNNNFTGNRTWATDWTSQITVTETEEAVTWELGNRKHICYPPYWEIKGEHMGVDCDIRLTGIGDAVYHKGKYSELAERGLAGYEHPLRAEGTITADGKTYTLKNAYGCQEKFIQTNWDLAATIVERPYYWVWWMNESIRIFIYHFPSLGRSVTHMYIDGEEVMMDQPIVTLNEKEQWIDPKTLMQVPVKWDFEIKSETASVEMDITADSRAFYSYLTNSGPTIHYGLLSFSDGSITLPDGKKLLAKDMMTYVEKGWCPIPLTPGC